VQGRLAAFLQGLQQLGWTAGRNLQIDTRWAAGNADHIRKHAAELVVSNFAQTSTVNMHTAGRRVNSIGCRRLQPI
jgi:hypothetical protein